MINRGKQTKRHLQLKQVVGKHNIMLYYKGRNDLNKLGHKIDKSIVEYFCSLIFTMSSKNLKLILKTNKIKQKIFI